jgi:hypothetical protein
MVAVFQQEVKLFTVEQANEALPRLRELLRDLRERKARVLEMQALSDVAEMTGPLNESEKGQAEERQGRLDEEINGFHRVFKILNRLGCELKDVDKGQVDFYALKDGQTIYLCWTEEEDRVAHWHYIHDGFEDRKCL